MHNIQQVFVPPMKSSFFLFFCSINYNNLRVHISILPTDCPDVMSACDLSCSAHGFAADTDDCQLCQCGESVANIVLLSDGMLCLKQSKQYCKLILHRRIYMALSTVNKLPVMI